MLAMKRPVLILNLLFTTIICLFTQCEEKCDDTYRFQFKFITENYKPLNYLEGNSVKGLAPDVLQEICNRLNIPFEVEFLPWDAGYDLVQDTGNAVLFSTILNSARKDLFKWAGPIASLDFMQFPEARLT
jgi:ABC-type amino acid transport substrate-binding protein